ncbi:hypothetical protein G7050_00045 [Dysgonomonas sp. HDW5A]|uniref:hypothetical protein n=1 Tax=Dysgonomonas sp. HDW5A TaxID=2714926 RepID=UPI0014082D51|nr:hypothetical protein [Dysgonomonas sp. HDW5A]QIK58310.1 hypothetical protein G7050_00045 [Dysgonomonas sp. HDW5A]
MKTFAGNQLTENPQTKCDTIRQARYKVLEIALKMKMKGLDNSLIAELTGLPLKDILLF